MFEALTADRDNQNLMIDSTVIRARQQAATGKEPVLSLPKQGRATKRRGIPEAD